MSAAAMPSLLRPDLLSEVGVVVTSAATAGDTREAVAESGFAAAISRACTDAGARVTHWPVEVDTDGVAVEATTARGPAEASVLISDSAAFYLRALRRSDGDGLQALRDCVDSTWRVTRAFAGAAAVAAGAGAVAPVSRTIIVAPPAHAGPHVDAARAALENLVRTVSVEWARHRITTVAVAPGADSDASHVGVVCAYLASRAGAYFSGCQLDLRGPGVAHERGRP